MTALPPAHVDQLEDVAECVERSETVLEKQTMNPPTHPAVIERDSKFADMLEGENQRR